MSFVKRNPPVWLKSYFCTALFIWLAILFYRYNPYYKSFLAEESQTVLLGLAVAYSVLAPLFYLILPERFLPEAKSLQIVRTIRRFVPEYWRYLNAKASKKLITPPNISYPEKTASLFLLVKFFFLPIMLNFLFANYHAVEGGLNSLSQISPDLLSIASFNSLLFPLLLSIFLLIDTAYFTFGYTIESRFLGNQVKSVEPTVLGWAVALISYPPFNTLLGGYVIWYANDYADFGSAILNFVMRVLILVLMGIFALSSVALGAKASNLTNRGIVSRGPYGWVRHPAYVSKNLAWWITIIPVLSFASVAGMVIWSAIYYMRAITEERHLIRDPAYQTYCQKVKYRFIPKVI